MRLLALYLAPGVLLGQGLVYNAASPFSSSFPPQLAPGSVAVIQYEPNDSSRTPRYSAVVSLRALGASTLTPAQVIAVDSGNITFVAPSALSPGPAQVIYKASGDTTKWVEISLVPASFAIKTAQIIDSRGGTRPSSLSRPAQAGESVVLWGTGLGAMPPSGIGVTFGGVSQQVLYAGAAPGQTGVNQINFQVSASVPDGCYVPVSVAYGGQTATTWLTKSTGGAVCPHPFGLSVDDLANLDAGLSIQAGRICTSSNVVAPSADHASRQESAWVYFTSENAVSLAAAFETNAPNSACPSASAGNTDPDTGAQSLMPPPPGGPVRLPVSISGTDATFSGLPAPVFTGGPWAWSNARGQDLAASSVTFNVLPPISIKGSIPFTWSSGKDQTITWNPAGYDSSAVLQASLYGSSPAAILGGFLFDPSESASIFYTAPSSSYAATFTAPANSGMLTIPSKAFQQTGTGAMTLTVQVSEPFAFSPSTLLRTKNSLPLVMLGISLTSETIPVDIQ
jgi:uncharacterized protein (TIGR03437 family)